MQKYSNGVATYRASEGKKVYVKPSGPADETIQHILGGVRSACTYVGAERLKDLPKCTTFVRVNRQLNNIFT
jgi:GMP reductase